jgi:hypothetical protein
MPPGAQKLGQTVPHPEHFAPRCGHYLHLAVTIVVGLMHHLAGLPLAVVLLVSAP